MLKVKGWNELQYANINQKKEGLATLISDKTGFRAKTGTFYNDKGVIYQEDIVILNVHVPTRCSLNN